MRQWGQRQEQMLGDGLARLYECERRRRGGAQYAQCDQTAAVLGKLQVALGAYAQILLQWQAAFGLLGRVGEHFVDLHLLDSISGALLLHGMGYTAGLEVIDVGSGLGLPGIPIALFLETWRQCCAPATDSSKDPSGYRVFLVERAARKAAILRSMLVELRLQQTVCVCEHRIEEWQQRSARPALQQADTFHSARRIVSCRAFHRLGPKSWKQLLVPLCGPQRIEGQGEACERSESSVQTGVLLYKGAWETARAELRGLGLEAQQTWFFRLPHCGHQRSLCYLGV